MITYSLDYYFNLGALHFVNYFENASFLAWDCKGKIWKMQGLQGNQK